MTSEPTIEPTSGAGQRGGGVGLAAAGVSAAGVSAAGVSAAGGGGASSFKLMVPNLLTAARVVLAIIFFWVLAGWDLRRSPIYRGEGADATLLIAAGIFILAAVTDALDGHLARAWNAVSAFGRIMDPFADKVLVLGAFVMLAGPGFAYEQFVAGTQTQTMLGMTPRGEVWSVAVSGVQPWMVVVILGRELLVTSIRGVVEGGGGTFAATWSGKFKMILQCVCVPGVLVLLNVPAGTGETEMTWPWQAIRALVWVTVVVTAWSGVPYVMRGITALRGARPVASDASGGTG